MDGSKTDAPQMQISREMYLYSVHVFQQLSKGVDLHQGDQLSAGGALSLSLFIDDRSQCRQLQVAVFLRKKAQKNKKKINKTD